MSDDMYWYSEHFCFSCLTFFIFFLPPTLFPYLAFKILNRFFPNDNGTFFRTFSQFINSKMLFFSCCENKNLTLFRLIDCGGHGDPTLSFLVFNKFIIIMYKCANYDQLCIFEKPLTEQIQICKNIFKIFLI